MPSPTPAPALCLHCQSPVPSSAPRPDYCCRGCEVVHALIVEQGLTRFYDLARGAAGPAEPPRDRSHAWLEPLLSAAEEGHAPGEIASLAIDVQGIHCAACVWLINELFRRQVGGAALRVNPALGKLRLSWRRGEFDVQAFVSDVERFGYLFGPDRKRPDAASRALPIRIGICAAISINVMMFSVSFYLGLADGALYTLFSRITIGLSAIVVLVGGDVFFRAAFRALGRGVLALDLPIAAGIALAFAASFAQALFGRGDRAYFDTLNVFVTLMLVGRWLQQRVLEKNRRFLVQDDGVEGLWARRRAGGVLELVPAALVRAGDELVVAPGDLVPVDALLLDAAARVSTDWITGESRQRSVALGETVAAGSFNAGRAAITITARTAFADSPLPRLLREPFLVESGAPPAHARFFDRYARVYVALVLVLGAAGGLLWWRLDPSRALDVVVAILVVTCPCAVGLAAPLATELAQVELRRAGFYVRSADLLERLARVRKVLFDKTGTLTLGRLALVGGDQPAALCPELRDAAFDLCARSNHPVSRCLSEELLRAGARYSPGAVVDEQPGAGLELHRGGHCYRLGRADFALGSVASAPSDGGTVLSVDGERAASFVTAEEVRPDARAEIAALRARGLDVWLISGDEPARVARFAAALDLPPDHALGGRRPEDKAADVARLDAGDTLYLGDGVNDSLAFERAYCAGTTAIDRPVVPGRCDFFVLGEGIAAIGAALSLSRRLRAVILRNLALALGYNALAVTACFLGWMSPLRAALAMPASSVALLLLTTASLRQRRGAPIAATLKTAQQLQGALAWKS